MKTIIAGSRTITEYEIVKEACKVFENCIEYGKISLVISGTANGVDKLGERWARENSRRLLQFYPNWGKYGYAAGHIRNGRMAENAEALLLIWDGKSTGSMNMLEQAYKRGLKILQVTTDGYINGFTEYWFMQ